jgi:uncharacterized protein YjbI with pentapeptide repeats
MALAALVCLGVGGQADAQGAPAAAKPPVLAPPVAPKPPSIATPVPPSVPVPGRPLRGPGLGATPGRCDPYFYSATSYGFPPFAAPDHAVEIGVTLNVNASSQYGYVTVYNGAVSNSNCSGIASQIRDIQNSNKAVFDNWLVMGPHTVLEADVAGSQLIWGTQRSPIRQPVFPGSSPLYEQIYVPPTQPMYQLWSTTGQLVIHDAMDWIRQYGRCDWGCDISGKTIDSSAVNNGTLVEAGPGSIPYLFAENTTFSNISFQPGSEWDYADFRNATFDNVSMDSVVFKHADFTGARFTSNTQIVNLEAFDSNFSSVSFGANVQVRGLRVTSDSAAYCTTFNGSNLLPPTIELASVTEPPNCGTPLFNAASVRPTIASLSLWRQVDWRNANVVWDATDRTYLHGADLNGISFAGARMTGFPADLENVNLSAANLTTASFVGMDLVGANMVGANASRAVFDGADLSTAMLNQPQGATTTFNNASFQNAKLDGASFSNASILGANFSRARAYGSTSFANTKAGSTVFDGAHILNNPAAFEGAVFDPDPSVSTGNVSFVGAVLGGNVATGSGINFSQAHLRQAAFNNAQCIGCIFVSTDLTGANFQNGYLAGARFNGATLTDAKLAGALISTTSGTWTFQLGVAEPRTSIPYAPTDFSGTSLTNVGSCPDSSVPNGDPVACNGHLNANPPAQMPPPCSAAGQDTCPLPVTTSVGTGTAGSSNGQVSNPAGIVVARNGDVYFADTGNHVVRRISGGSVTTFAGQVGLSGDSGDGGSASAAQLKSPVGLALGYETPPTVYIADRDANRIRKVTQVFDSSGALHTTISAVAGSGQPCPEPVAGSCGDGDNPQQVYFAALSAPEAVWVDPLGNVYIADTQDNKIRVATNAGAMHTIAGTGSAGYGGDGGPARSAILSGPAGLVGDMFGNVFLSDTENNRVRKIDPSGTITTVFGTGTAGYNGSYAQDPLTFQWTYPKAGTTAQLNRPRGLSVNTSNGLFVADTGNGLIRRLNTSSGSIALVAGKTKESGNSSTVDTSFNGDNLPSNQTGFSQPYGVAVTVSGAFRVTDTGHQRVRSFGPSAS